MGWVHSLSAWGAVEKNARRLRLVNSVIGYVIVGFVACDAILAFLQRDHLFQIQRVACFVQPVNFLTGYLIPAHFSGFVRAHCAASDFPDQTAAYVYLMTKLTLAMPMA